MVAKTLNTSLNTCQPSIIQFSWNFFAQNKSSALHHNRSVEKCTSTLNIYTVFHAVLYFSMCGLTLKVFVQPVFCYYLISSGFSGVWLPHSNQSKSNTIQALLSFFMHVMILAISATNFRRPGGPAVHQTWKCGEPCFSSVLLSVAQGSFSFSIAICMGNLTLQAATIWNFTVYSVQYNSLSFVKKTGNHESLYV